MLRHLNCIFFDAAAGPAIKAAADAPPLAKVASPINSAKDAATNEVTPTADFAFNGSAAAALAETPGHLVTLPQATPQLGINFRLFASNGKLLLQMEDDLELYPPTGQLAGEDTWQVTKCPIAFHLPAEGDKMLTGEQRGCNNSYFKRQWHGGSCATPAACSSAATTATGAALSASCLPLTTPLDTGIAPCDPLPCRFYFGSVHPLRCELLTAAPGNHHRLNQRHRHSCPEASPLLLEPDGLSGRTASVGCVPSVSVARPRQPLRHRETPFTLALACSRPVTRLLP